MIRTTRFCAGHFQDEYYGEYMDINCIYQIYPLGFCGAPRALAQNGPDAVPRIRKVIDWIPHLKALGVDTVLFNPLFASSTHGYDTANLGELDPRLGTNEDFAEVCRALHENGLRVMLDGVFNHVGREFWAFRDLREKREQSPWRDWFFVDFSRDSGYGDGFWYEGWEGHYELVKLNLGNPAVVDHLFENIRFWVEKFGIDGLRLDVAYCLESGFLRRIREFTESLKPGFFLVGEVLFGDYNRIAGDGLLHSCTNYECYKGLYSSLNCRNLFELTYSLNRQFGPEPWCIYTGKRLMSFADNHDVSRIASILLDKRMLPAAYALLFGMPGIPCLYYGSEWGALGEKKDGDDALRPCFDAPVENELSGLVSKLVKIRAQCGALGYGGYRNLVERNESCVFLRRQGEQRVAVAVNISDAPVRLEHGELRFAAHELIGDKPVQLDGAIELAPMSFGYFQAN